MAATAVTGLHWMPPELGPRKLLPTSTSGYAPTPTLVGPCALPQPCRRGRRGSELRAFWPPQPNAGAGPLCRPPAWSAGIAGDAAAVLGAAGASYRCAATAQRGARVDHPLRRQQPRRAGAARHFGGAHSSQQRIPLLGTPLRLPWVKEQSIPFFSCILFLSCQVHDVLLHGGQSRGSFTLLSGVPQAAACAKAPSNNEQGRSRRPHALPPA